jgi:3-methyladenine DNA glycosylase AlkC
MTRVSPGDCVPAQTTANVSAATRQSLNRGEAASRTLVELLVIDFAQLMQHVARAPDAALMQLRAAQGDVRDDASVRAMQETLARAGAKAPKTWKPGTKLGITQRMALAGGLLAEHDAKAVNALATHTSDTVRGWAAYAAMRGTAAPRTLNGKLTAIKPFAADEHSGVREWAWMAVRPAIEAEPQRAIELLTAWTASRDANLRRFASEATRPRGVWCSHITMLRKDPSAGLPLLELLRADASRYVQNSVANWLNDASKDAPALVRGVAKRWQQESACAETAYIIRRAMRTLRVK